MVDLELHPHEIAPILKKNLINLFVCIKFNFLLTIFLALVIYSLGGHNRNKTRPGDHESNFKKVGAIPIEPKNSYDMTFFSKLLS